MPILGEYIEITMCQWGLTPYFILKIRAGLHTTR